MFSSTPTRFRLRPGTQVERAGSAFVSLGDDPSFLLQPIARNYPSGRGVFTFALAIESGDPVEPRLYFDTGNGYGEDHSVALGRWTHGLREVEIELPANLVALRLDPMARTGRFRLAGATFHAGATLPVPVAVPVPAPPTFTRPEPADPYEAWVAVNRLTSVREAAIRQSLASLSHHPRFSVVMPTYNTPPGLLDEAIESVRGQLYDQWELVAVDDASPEPATWRTLQAWADRDGRIRVHRRHENGNISRSSNEAAALATGEWLVFLDHDDLLAPEALALLALHLAEHPTDELVYSDDDKIDESGRRFAPQFKPDWSPELMLAFSYTSHIKCVAVDLWRRVGGFRVGFEGSQDYDFMLRASEQARSVGHVPQVLYHWRAISGSTASSGDAKPKAIEAGRKAVEEAFHRRGVPCRVERPDWAAAAGCGIYAPVFGDDGPRVAIIIPTKNQWRILKRCLDSLPLTTYRNYRVIVIDNESDEAESLDYLAEQTTAEVWQIANPGGRFSFAHINNEAARRVDDSELLLFLNNDTEVREPRWLSQMVGWSRLPGVGAVGARLLYPDGRIQHSGIVHGHYHGLAAPAFKLAPSWDKGYLSYAGVSRDYLAVTAACLLTPRRTFLDLGGFDAAHFAVAYNDVDYGYRLAEAGLRSVCCAEAELLHHEGLSRGFRDDPRELVAFRQRYGGKRDPYYNPHLGFEHERFPIRPRVVPPPLAGAVRKPVKAVLVSHSLNWEGAPNSLFEFASGLKRQGILDPVVWSPVEGPLRKAWEAAGIAVEVVEPPPCGGSLEDFDRGLDQLAARLREMGVEVVYGNTLQVFWIIAGAQRARLPAVWNVRESEPWPTYYDFLPKPIAARAYACLAYPYRVVFVADTTRAVWSDLDTSHNYTVIRNGLDLKRLEQRAKGDRTAARRRLGWSDDEVVLLLLGTICARKGQQDLIRAYAAMPHEQAIRARCLLVGDRPSDYSRELHALVEALPADRRDRVTIVGETGATADYWAAGDVFVCTSRVESYPRVVLEAMAIGLPVVSTPCFGITEQVRPEINGRFYPEGDHQSLAATLAELVRDDALRHRWAENSPHVVAGLTGYDEMIAGYGAIFREAALSHPPEGHPPVAQLPVAGPVGAR